MSNKDLTSILENDLESIIELETTKNGPTLEPVCNYPVESMSHKEFVFIQKGLRWLNYYRNINTSNYMVVMTLKEYYEDNQEMIDRMLDYQTLEEY